MELKIMKIEKPDGCDVSQSEAKTEAETYWTKSAEAIEEVIGSKIPTNVHEVLHAATIAAFISGAGWMRSELSDRQNAFVKNLLEAQMLNDLESSDQPS